MAIVLDTAAKVHSPAPAAALATKHMDESIAAGDGELDSSAFFKILRKKSNSVALSPTLSRKREREQKAIPPLPRAGEGWGEGESWKKRHASSLKARKLRQNTTDAEMKFWHEVKAKRFHGLKFKRQYPVGPYYADFACVEENLIVEIDGGQHCENAKDEARTRFLEKEGFKVVRFWNNEILNNMEGVLLTLSLALSRQRERGQVET
jgi:very-short-patch-repair endonuclease